MGVPVRHVLNQGPVLAALVRAGVAASRSGGAKGPALDTPTPELTATLKPRPEGLVRDYVRHVGGDPSWYRGVVPAHLFPQWGFPLLARTLEGIPYDLKRVLNGGCRIEMNRPLPAGEPLHLRACLAHIDDDGRRAVLQQRLITGTDSAPDAVISTLYAIVPLQKGDGKKDKPRLPDDAREIGRMNLPTRVGFDFAVLTGDFNPIHWIGPAARAAGFKSTINHGFSTLARAIETLNRVRFAGDPSRLATIDVKFTRPLVLPARVGVYLLGDDGVGVGDSPGGPAYLTGTTTLHPTDGS